MELCKFACGFLGEASVALLILSVRINDSSDKD